MNITISSAMTTAPTTAEFAQTANAVGIGSSDLLGIRRKSLIFNAIQSQLFLDDNRLS